MKTASSRIPRCGWWLLSLWIGAALAAEFKPLFNGRDLSGWVNINTAPSTWTWKDGVLQCTGAPVGELRTERMYQNFILELEWRHLRAGGNAGVFVWADPIPARGQPFVRGIEVQVLDGREGDWFTSDGDIFPIHGATMIPLNDRGGDRAFPTEKRMRPSPEWNHYRIECRDGAISLAVNGAVVTRAHSASPRKGYICLESEGSPVEFRNVRLQELPATVALPPEQIARPDEGYVPLYTGVDFAGWNPPAGEPPVWRVADWTFASTSTGDKAGTLWTSAEWGDVGLIVDWRRPKDAPAGAAPAQLLLRGVDGIRVTLAGQGAIHLPGSAAPIPFASQAERAAGEWNRTQLRLRGNQLTLLLNDEVVASEVTLPGVPPRGALGCVPGAGTWEFANWLARRWD